MLRLIYALGTGYVLLCAYAISTLRSEPEPMLVQQPSTLATPLDVSTPIGWFQGMKPYCNSLEVETRHRYTPPPATPEGRAYSAACFALAGRIDSAREIILGLPANQRGRAAGILFDIGHPVADAGDDASAGPMMSLVVEFWPENYMALYHAGVSNAMIGQRDLAKRQLARFVELYRAEDGWRSNAITVLARLNAEPPR